VVGKASAGMLLSAGRHARILAGLNQ